MYVTTKRDRENEDWVRTGLWRIIYFKLRHHQRHWNGKELSKLKKNRLPLGVHGTAVVEITKQRSESTTKRINTKKTKKETRRLWSKWGLFLLEVWDSELCVFTKSCSRCDNHCNRMSRTSHSGIRIECFPFWRRRISRVNMDRSEERNFYDDKPSSPCLFGAGKKKICSQKGALQNTLAVLTAVTRYLPPWGLPLSDHGRHNRKKRTSQHCWNVHTQSWQYRFPYNVSITRAFFFVPLSSCSALFLCCSPTSLPLRLYFLLPFLYFPSFFTFVLLLSSLNTDQRCYVTFFPNTVM